MPHGRYERIGKVRTHFPVHALPAAPGRSVNKMLMSGFGQFHGPGVVNRIAKGAGDPVKRVHPLGQIMEVLAVPVPFHTFVVRFGGAAFLELLTDSQTADCGMLLAFRLVQPADPPGLGVVPTSPAEGVMDLIHEPQRQIPIPGVFRQIVETQEIADGKGVGPEISFRRGGAARRSGCFREIGHQLHQRGYARAVLHGVSPCRLSCNRGAWYQIRDNSICHLSIDSRPCKMFYFISARRKKIPRGAERVVELLLGGSPIRSFANGK